MWISPRWRAVRECVYSSLEVCVEGKYWEWLGFEKFRVLQVSKFVEDFVQLERACVFRGLVKSWKGIEKWRNIDYFEKYFDVIVDVEHGEHFAHPDARRVSIPFGMALNAFELGGSDDLKLYLAQTDLLSEIPDLRPDVLPIPWPVVQVGKGQEHAVSNTWMGPVGSFSPLHTDPQSNLLCQVLGKKLVLLSPPSSEPPLGTIGQYSRPNTTAAVADLTNPEEDAKLAKEFRGEFAILDPGDAIYIPSKTWHFVKTIQADTWGSASVNWWWPDT